MSSMHVACNHKLQRINLVKNCHFDIFIVSERRQDLYTSVFIISAQAQMQVAMNVGTYHYDMLFDQYKELTDSRASEVVKKYYNYVQDTIDPMLKKRNNRRFREGHLTYPYLEHYWLPNGIQT